MQTNINDVTQAVAIIRPYLSAVQLSAMGDACRGEGGGAWFKQRFIDLQREIERRTEHVERDMLSSGNPILDLQPLYSLELFFIVRD